MTRTKTTQRFLLAAARGLVSTGVVLSPWLFGSAEGWAYLLICILCGGGVAAWLLSLAIASEVRIRAPMISLILLLILGFVVLQAVRLPPMAVRVLNPAVADIQEQTRILLAHLGTMQQLPEFPESGSFSVSPAATWRSVFLWIAYAGTFLVMANAVREWSQARRFAGALVISGFAMAVLAIIHKFSGSMQILWVHAPRYQGNIFGPFTNRNHFAAHMNMLFGVALGLALSSQQLRRVLVCQDWRDRLEWLSSRNASRTAMNMFALVLIGGAVFISLSRGAMLSLLISLCLLAIILTWKQRSFPVARSAIILMTSLIVVAVLWLGSDQVVQRLGTLRDVVRNPLEDFRAIVTRDTLTAYGVCPLVGWGFGTYRHVFSMFQRPDLMYRWLHAHNDWAQLLAEGGIVGTMLFLFALREWVVYIVRRFANAGISVRLFLIGLFTGLTTIALHSFLDYSLHKPGNALLVAALAGLACASVHLRGAVVKGRDVAKTKIAVQPVVLPELPLRVTALVLLIGMIALNIVLWRDLRGELAFTRFTYLERLALRTVAPAEKERVVGGAANEAELIAGSGYDPDTLSEVSRTLVDWSMDTTFTRPFRTALAMKAERIAARATVAAPSNYLPWLEMARAEFLLGVWDGGSMSLSRARQLVSHPEQVRMFASLPWTDE